MTRTELAELIAKPADALTSSDIEQLRHMASVVDAYRDDPEGLERYFRSYESKSPTYADVTAFGGRVVTRVRIS